MFEILGSLVVKGLEKIIDTAIDLEKQSITERLKFFRHLVGLYNSLGRYGGGVPQGLEGILGYATGKVALTRTMPVNYLDRLGASANQFRSYLAPISSITDIYDGELRASLGTAISLKDGNIEDYENIILPYMREAYFMNVPTREPGDMLQRLFALGGDRRTWQSCCRRRP